MSCHRPQCQPLPGQPRVSGSREAPPCAPLEHSAPLRSGASSRRFGMSRFGSAKRDRDAWIERHFQCSHRNPAALISSHPARGEGYITSAPLAVQLRGIPARVRANPFGRCPRSGRCPAPDKGQTISHPWICAYASMLLRYARWPWEHVPPWHAGWLPSDA